MMAMWIPGSPSMDGFQMSGADIMSNLLGNIALAMLIGYGVVVAIGLLVWFFGGRP